MNAGWTCCYSIPQRVTIVTAKGQLTFTKAMRMLREAIRQALKDGSRGLIVDLCKASIVLEAADIGLLRDAVMRAWGGTSGRPLAVASTLDPAVRRIAPCTNLRVHFCMTVIEAITWIDYVCHSKPSSRDTMIRKIVRIISLVPDDRLSTLADGLEAAVKLLQPAHRTPSSGTLGRDKTPPDPEAPS